MIVLKDDGISFEKTAICHIDTFFLASIRKCHFEIGESAHLIWLGILGQFAILQLRAAGAVPFIAAIPIKEKQELEAGKEYNQRWRSGRNFPVVQFDWRLFK